MACNENIIKNVATEVTRNCQAQNVNVEIEFVGFLIDLLLLNPKYGKQFAKSLNRSKLEYFVNECVAMLTRGEPYLNTLKMQFVMISNYDKLGVLLQKQRAHVDSVLKPLVDEIMDADPDDDDDAAFKKLYRKICIYILMASALGNPSTVVNLKETMSALESVYDLEELYLWVTLPRSDKMEKLEELLKIISGVRLYNRDCKLGGEMIPDLPMDLVDASKACLSTLCNSLISVMQRVNMLTTAIDQRIVIEEETGNIVVSVPKGSDLTIANYKQIFELLIFNRQYEMYTRRLLYDVELMVRQAKSLQSQVKEVLDNIHAVCRYKSAVPVDCVFPLFTQLWEVWQAMQDTMFLVSTITRLTTILGTIQDHMKIPYNILDAMLQGRQILTDEERLSIDDSFDETSIVNLRAISATKSESLLTVVHIERNVQYLGFCVVCLCQGALVPCNLKLGMFKYGHKRFGFCTYKMAWRFSKDPQRYINEVLDFARNNPQIINLLNLREEVEKVREIDELVVRFVPKIKTNDKDIQTETHLKERYIDANYTWDLWEWKKRACKWATVTNCKTHSTQTVHSHLRSDHHVQTVQPRDQCHQTQREVGIMTNMCHFYVWGLRGLLGYGQHSLSLEPPHLVEKLKPTPVEQCNWPCFGETQTSAESSYAGSDDDRPFYNPNSYRKDSKKKQMGWDPTVRSSSEAERRSFLRQKPVIVGHMTVDASTSGMNLSNQESVDSNFKAAVVGTNNVSQAMLTSQVSSGTTHTSSELKADFNGSRTSKAVTNASITSKADLTALSESKAYISPTSEFKAAIYDLSRPKAVADASSTLKDANNVSNKSKAATSASRISKVVINASSSSKATTKLSNESKAAEKASSELKAVTSASSTSKAANTASSESKTATNSSTSKAATMASNISKAATNTSTSKAATYASNETKASTNASSKSEAATNSSTSKAATNSSTSKATRSNTTSSTVQVNSDTTTAVALTQISTNTSTSKSQGSIVTSEDAAKTSTGTIFTSNDTTSASGSTAH